jgi:hypothetical protein
MVSYYDVSGCYILRPWSFAVWEAIQDWFGSRIKSLGVKNVYFPLFITEDRLNTEKDHVEGVREFFWRFGKFFFLSPVENETKRKKLTFLSFSLSLSLLPFSSSRPRSRG